MVNILRRERTQIEEFPITLAEGGQAPAFALRRALT